jgi:DNA-binding MltR family transcriptional regulator
VLDTYTEFQKNYDGESDRSVVILAGSFLEQVLEKYLLKKFVDSPSVTKLFTGYSPLATFAAKIDIAFAIGLLPVHVYEDLKVIKKLRNIFAHEADVLNFESSRVCDICSNLQIAKRSDGDKWDVTGSKNKYLNAVFFAMLHIDTEADRVTKLKVPKFRFEVVIDDDEQNA